MSLVRKQKARNGCSRYGPVAYGGKHLLRTFIGFPLAVEVGPWSNSSDGLLQEMPSQTHA
jgi:hypothetical protein